MARSISIRRRLLTDLAILVTLLGLALLGATFLGTRRAVRTLSQSIVRQSLATAEARLDGFFTGPVRQLGIAREQAAGRGLGSIEQGREARNLALLPILQSYPQLSSILLATDDGREHMLMRDGRRWRNRLTDRGAWGDDVRWVEWEDGQPATRRVERTGYDPRTRPWFIGAVEALDVRGEGAVHWTDPYAFFTTGKPGITVASAWRDDEGGTIVIGFDILLEDLSRFTRKQHVGRRGMMAVLSDRGRLIGLPAHPAFDDSAAAGKAYLQRPADIGLTLFSDAAQAFEADPGPNTTVRFRSGGRAWWGLVEPYPLSARRRLYVGIVVPEADLLDGIFLERVTIIVVVLAVLAAGMARAAILARRFSAPIEALVERSERIRGGDLDPPPPVRSSVKEIRRLALAQESMREGIAARLKLEKVQRDLDLARDIQRRLLPAATPALPRMEIAGWNRPADETGGDFYDWLSLPDGRLVITLADVTGHGIGPALIVAGYRAYLRASASFGHARLADALRIVNDLICTDTPADRFITAVAAVLDPRACRMRLLSAGHGPQVMYRAAEDAVESWPADALPLGVVEGIEIGPPREIEFAAGDMLLLLTDGFFEWVDPDGEAFGSARLEAFVHEHHALGASEFIAALHEAVLAHARGTEQKDDLTAVVIRARSPGEHGGGSE